MKIAYKQKYNLDNPAVIKLWFGEKYLVLKVCDFKEELPRLITTLKDGTTPAGDIKPYVTRRIKSAYRSLDPKKGKCVVEVVLSTTKGGELIAREQALLNAHDVECLNSNKTATYPMWIHDYIMPSKRHKEGVFTIKGRHAAAPGVVKLWVGPKFFIWKCMDLKVFPEKFSESMEINLVKYDPRRADNMNPLTEYMLNNNIMRGRIEVVYKPDLKKRNWILRFLAEEKKLLNQYVRKSVCLNRSTRVYIPEWVEKTLNPPDDAKK